MPVTLQSGAETVTLRDPEFSNSEVSVPAQAVGRTAAGELYVYDKGRRRRTMSLRFEFLSDSEKTSLEDFYLLTAEGALNAFSLTDHRGRTYSARFLEPVEFSEVSDGRWDCELTLEVEETT